MSGPKDELMPHLRISPRPVACAKNIILDAPYRVTVLTDRLFRVERSGYTDEATQAVWYRDFPAVDYTWEADEAELRVKTDALTLHLHKGSFPDSRVVFDDGRISKLDNRENLLGTCSTLDTNGYHLREHPSVTQYDRAHIPLDMGVCSRSGVAVYDDSMSLLLSPDGTLKPRGGALDVYVFAYGHDYLGAVKALYRLCGSTPMIPRWALGNWWSRYWPYTQQEYLDLMDNFADDHIPISVSVLDMDWHYVCLEDDFHLREQGLDDEAHGGSDGWTGYTWNEKLFPDHVALLKSLHDRGLHTTLNLHPALGVRWYEKAYPQMAEGMGMDPGQKLAVPFQIADRRFVNLYLSLLHHPLEEEGVDFWWIDWQQGKDSGLAGLDPLWALNHYHYLDSVHRHGQGLILSRYAGVGSHRYPVGFSGDTHMDWEFLDYMPYFTATAANVGYGWWSHDIGGHHKGLRDEELYLRWLQFGVFSPINRIHCGNAAVICKDPWSYSEPTRAMAEKLLRFRHKLVPYLYSAAWKNTLEGVPLIRPMYYQWPEEDAAYEADHQYLFGDLLVAPITRKAAQSGIGEKQVWLPAGVWTDIFANLTYDGNRWITVYRDSGSIPVFAPAGAILPLDAAPDNRCETPDRLEVFVYTGDGCYELLEGDGPSRTVFVSAADQPGTQTLTISGGPNRQYHLFFKNVKTGNCTLSVDGFPRPVTLRHNRCLQAIFSLEDGETARLTVKWSPPDPISRLRENLLALFIQLPHETWHKDKLWNATRHFQTVEEWEHWIASLDVSEPEKSMLRERLQTL